MLSWLTIGHLIRFNRGGFQRDYRRGRRSPSPYRGRNRGRRSRSSSFEYRNRRASNDRSASRDRKQNNRDAPPLPPPAPQNYQPSDYYPAPVGQNMAAPFAAQQPSYPGYDFQMQPQAPPFPPFPNDQPPAHPLWNHIPPPPVLDEQQPKVLVTESEEDKQKREGIHSESEYFQIFFFCFIQLNNVPISGFKSKRVLPWKRNVNAKAFADSERIISVV